MVRMEAKRLEKIWRKDGEIKDDGGKIEAKNRGEKMVKQWRKDDEIENDYGENGWQ